MKILVTAVTALLFTNAISAQGLSAGLRTGIGGNTDITGKMNGDKQVFWNKQVFGRYETNKRFAFELNAGQYQYSYDFVPAARTLFLPELSETINIHSKINNLEVGASVQYDITCSFLKEKCPAFKNFKSYIGINASMVSVNEEATRTDKMFSDGTIIKSKSSNSIARIYTGLSHTAIYNFKHIFLSSTASFVVDPLEFGSTLQSINNPGYSNTRVSLMIGAGYRF